jgi:hypothetical protein
LPLLRRVMHHLRQIINVVRQSEFDFEIFFDNSILHRFDSAKVRTIGQPSLPSNRIFSNNRTARMKTVLSHGVLRTISSKKVGSHENYSPGSIVVAKTNCRFEMNISTDELSSPGRGVYTLSWTDIASLCRFGTG